MSLQEARVPDAESTRGPALLRLLRPHHWVKNGFVLLPVPFSLAAGARLDLPLFLAGFAGFCLLNSAVYVLNDIRDAEADRLSPRKRTRPIAAGAVSLPAAWGTLAVVLGCALALGAATGLAAVLTIYGIYLAANVAYSLGAKHVPLLDVFILGSGFLLRVLLGTALVQAPPSSWLLLCTSALALFLAFAKRRGDLVEGMGAEHRPALSGYSERYLDAALGICAGLALVTYALYCGEAEVLEPGREMASLPPVAFAVFQYLRLALVGGAGANPVKLAWSERSLQVCGVIWLVAISWSLGLF